MSLTKLNDNLNHISSLPDKPTTTSEELKRTFDQAGNDIKRYINETLTQEIDTLMATQNRDLNTKITNLQSTLATVSNTISEAQFDKIYPIGSIYVSVNSTNPEILFGGTWERIKDKFLLSAGDKYAEGSTGGEETHVLTSAEMPRHRHSITTYGDLEGASTIRRVRGTEKAANGINDYSSYVGESKAHNNMPPYLTVNVWKRIS